MAKRPNVERLPPPNLVQPKAQVIQTLQQQIALGHAILRAPMDSRETLDSAEQQGGRWDAANAQLLLQMFDNRSVADEYEYPTRFAYSMGPTTLREDVQEFRERIEAKLGRLDRYLARVEVMTEPRAGAFPAPPTPRAGEPKVVRPSQTIHIHHGGTINIGQTGSGDVTQTVNATDLADVRKQLRELEDAIHAADAPQEELQTYADGVEQLRGELAQPRPIRARLLMGWNALQLIGMIESSWQGWERAKRIASELAPRVQALIQAVTNSQT